MRECVWKSVCEREWECNSVGLPCKEEWQVTTNKRRVTSYHQQEKSDKSAPTHRMVLTDAVVGLRDAWSHRRPSLCIVLDLDTFTKPATLCENILLAKSFSQVKKRAAMEFTKCAGQIREHVGKIMRSIGESAEYTGKIQWRSGSITRYFGSSAEHTGKILWRSCKSHRVSPKSQKDRRTYKSFRPNQKSSGSIVKLPGKKTKRFGNKRRGLGKITECSARSQENSAKSWSLPAKSPSFWER